MNILSHEDTASNLQLKEEELKEQQRQIRKAHRNRALASLQTNKSPEEEIKELLLVYGEIDSFDDKKAIDFFKDINRLWYWYTQIEYSEISLPQFSQKLIRQHYLSEARKACVEQMVSLCLKITGGNRRHFYPEFWKTICTEESVYHVVKDLKKILRKVPLWFCWGCWEL
ncbi:MAG: hypothetical protein WCV55_01665 [Candidatus Paceibacterota bacterium]